MNKKKKSGSIAIPFLLTFLISLIIIGGIAIVIYDKIDSDNSSLITMPNEAASLSSADNHTVLLILDLSKSTFDEDDYYEEEEEDESGSDDDNDDDDDEDDEVYDWEDTGDEEKDRARSRQYTFMVMRSMPVNKQIIFIGLPENMHVGKNNLSLTETYKTKGTAELKAAVEYSLEIPVDRYMVFDSNSFRKMCNILGGVNFAVPGNVDGFRKTDGLQYLSPEQIEKLIRYSKFGGGEVQRMSIASSLITSMVNQASGARIADNLDNTFEAMVNANDTDISALDYQQEKYAIKFLMKNSDPKDDETSSERAKFLTPPGTQTDEAFILDTSFLNDLSKYFAADEQSAPVQESTLKPMIPETEAQDDDENQ